MRRLFVLLGKLLRKLNFKRKPEIEQTVVINVYQKSNSTVIINSDKKR